MASELTLARSLDGFRQMPPAQRLGFLVALAAAASLVAAWWLWSQTPDWRVLYSNLSDRDGGAVVGALSQMNVPYKVAEGGGAILVPAAQVHDARLKLASQGLPKGSVVGFEILDAQKLGATQFQEQVAYQRALEGELARSIQSLAAVAGARVHLAIPRATSFLRESQKPTASVLVNLHPGRSLERSQVAGIVHLVASSVPELAPKAVSVVDQNGTLLSTSAPGEGGTELDAGQLAYVNQIEGALARRIEEILEPVVGRANVRAQVTADVDFSVQESTAESYKPNASGQEASLRSQSVSEQSDARGSTLAGGIPGATSNTPAAAPAATTTSSGGSSRKDTNTQYELDRTVKRVRQPVGTVKRLSAAVVVNHRTKTDADGKVTTVALTPEEMTQIQALVKEAMGFSQARGDTLNVANTAFAVEAVAKPVETPIWKDPENIATAKEVAKSAGIALVALYLLLGVLRPLLRSLAASSAARPALEAIEGEARPAGPGEDPVQAVRALARQDPKRVANVVKTWVSANE